ncbi:hypothetical protein D9M71_476310 [compost metagenome]
MQCEHSNLVPCFLEGLSFFKNTGIIKKLIPYDHGDFFHDRGLHPNVAEALRITECNLPRRVNADA